MLSALAAGAQERYNSSGNRRVYKSTAHRGGFDPNRLIYGGGLGLSFGTVTNLGLSPVLGYRFTNWFSAGISLGYQYMRISDQVSVLNYNTGYYESKPFVSNIYSGSVWAREVVYGDFFLQEEFEHNILSYRNYTSDQSGIHHNNVNYGVPCLLLGAGYRMRMSDNISMIYYIFYDALQNIDHNTMVDSYTGEKYSISPYAGSLNFRIGINVGF